MLVQDVCWHRWWSQKSWKDLAIITALRLSLHLMPWVSPALSTSFLRYLAAVEGGCIWTALHLLQDLAVCDKDVSVHHGLQGESVEYYRPDNSLLPYVLTARRGIPISLAITHAAVARRAVSVGRDVSELVYPLSNIISPAMQALMPDQSSFQSAVTSHP